MAEDREITISKGQRAATLLNDPLLKGAFEELERSYMAAWRATTLDDVAGREKLFLAVNIVGKIRDHLQKVLDGGKLAKIELNEIIDAAERKKRFGIL